MIALSGALMASFDPPDREKEEKIRRDLARTVIKEPLYAEIKAMEGSSKDIPILIEVNDEYYKGKAEAVKWLDSVVQDAAASVHLQVSSRVTSVGGDQNP